MKWLVKDLKKSKRGCEITASTEKEDFSFKMNERSSFMLCVQRSWTTLAGASPVTVIASEPCS